MFWVVTYTGIERIEAALRSFCAVVILGRLLDLRGTDGRMRYAQSLRTFWSIRRLQVEISLEYRRYCRSKRKLARTIEAHGQKGRPCYDNVSMDVFMCRILTY